MRIISIGFVGVEEEFLRDVNTTLRTLVGGNWKIDGVVRYEGTLYYVVTSEGSHKLPRNEVATQVVRRVLCGVVVLVRKGDELP